VHVVGHDDPSDASPVAGNVSRANFVCDDRCGGEIAEHWPPLEGGRRDKVDSTRFRPSAALQALVGHCAKHPPLGRRAAIGKLDDRNPSA
jgi:hypothetical protein